MSNWDPKANDIFLQAIEITAPEERGRFLDEACAADLALRARVEALIRSHEQAGEFLGRPILEPVGGPGPGGDATRTGPSTVGDVSLDFLAPSDKPGSLGRLGHYEVQEVVGRGGMGVVLKAFDENLHRVVAIKVMAPQLATVATARARFTREARAQAAIAHEHVVTIHAVEEANGLPYIVMQYVAGASLQDRLDRAGPLRLNEVLRIGVQAAAGLAAAHKQGLVHRDIKPANILLENGVERVKLTDFGLARAADDASLTGSGQVTGTPMYMSPEQAEGKPIDVRSDLFSLGSVLYAMCAGRPPFRAASTMAVLRRVCEDTPTPVREVNPEVPDWLADAIAKLHAKNPAERFQSADEVADLLGGLLARVQRPFGAVDKPAAAPARRRRRWIVAAAVLALLAAGLATTEATGVTRLRAAVARVFTPADPSVVEGGPAEPVRPAGVPVVGSRQFVILACGGRAERQVDTLAEAIRLACSDDTIEVRGNGPFLQERILITKAVRIRAGEGFRPVFHVDPTERPPTSSPPVVIESYLPLVREGLEFQQTGADVKPLLRWPIIVRGHDSLYVANCRFVSGCGVGWSPLQLEYESPCGEVCNCQFLGKGPVLYVRSANRIAFRNNLVVTPSFSSLTVEFGPAAHANLRLTRNTLVGACPVCISFYRGAPLATLDQGAAATKLLHVEASGNIFDGTVELLPLRLQHPPEKPAEVWQRSASWGGDHNLFAPNARLSLKDVSRDTLLMSSNGLADWKKFWDTLETGSVEGSPRYLGGDVRGRAFRAPESLTSEGFRLQPESAGHGVGPNKEDLGADVDLVGPGPAYERWKKTPEYQQWLKDSGQALAVVPQASDRPFVILGGGKGAADRTFPTLAEAVRAAADGDTVEVRAGRS